MFVGNTHWAYYHKASSPRKKHQNKRKSERNTVKMEGYDRRRKR